MPSTVPSSPQSTPTLQLKTLVPSSPLHPEKMQMPDHSLQGHQPHAVPTTVPGASAGRATPTSRPLHLPAAFFPTLLAVQDTGQGCLEYLLSALLLSM